MGSITVAGLGINPTRHATIEVLECISSSDMVFHSVAGDSVRAWIRSLAVGEEDLNTAYIDGLPRIKAYRSMADRVVNAARGGANVAFAVYGHPCLLHTGVQLTLRSAAQYNLPIKILPGVSSIDGLMAVLGIDPGFGGMHILEASDMLQYGRIPERYGHVVLLQVAVTGSRFHIESGHKGENINVLLQRLATLYAPNHRALHFRLQTAEREDFLRWTFVGKLHLEKWSNSSSLYIPPVRTSVVDAPFTARGLGL